MDLWLAITLAMVGVVGWVFGAMKPHRRVWVLVGIVPSLALLVLYFFFMLPQVRPELYSGSVQLGWPQLAAIIGGVWALLSKPNEPAPPKRHDDQGNGVHA